MYQKSAHTFHIPVMGLAYTIDSPIKVAKYGISSVISIIEDRLIEMMRKHYYPLSGLTYVPITDQEPDYRAKRICDYLNLVDLLVSKQVEELKVQSFEAGSDLCKYFEMLPATSHLAILYAEMLNCADLTIQKEQQEYLVSQVVAGGIDVNIMTKVDQETLDVQGNSIPDGSEAVAALRGYINSSLSNSSIIFSAGMNPRLYSYMESVSAFDPDKDFNFKKRVVIKVSDFRSALIQGKFLAKKGIWVSEFRIESGLNCGGHAFATDGFLLGPILEEFKTKRNELAQSIFDIYKISIEKKTGFLFTDFPAIEISVQGGIGTAEEDSFLRSNYQVSSTGWGTPFLLVPEATTVDEHTLQLLAKANKEDVVLSNNSPLGVRFHYLKGTTSDLEKQKRIKDGKPGSPCTEKHLSFNTEFTKAPICTASHKYQKLKLESLSQQNLPEADYEMQKSAVLAKECLCVGLSNSAALSYDEPFLKNLKSVNVCPGPNIANFSEVVSLKTMIDHIYGKVNIIRNAERPHVFIAEMKIYFNYLTDELNQLKGDSLDAKRKNHFQNFIKNLADAIEYYQNLKESSFSNFKLFREGLQQALIELNSIKLNYQFS